ncbi:efflux RND transporter permease subunit [Acidobacteriota bacterium]
MKLSAFAISNYQFTIILILLLVISGLVSFLTMPRSEDPQVAPSGTSVIVIYPGSSPVDVEQLIVDPIEDKINELNDIKRIESLCGDGLGVVDVEFHPGVDMDETYSELVQKVNSIRNQLPQDIMELNINRWNMSDFVIILQIAMISETASFRMLDDEAERLKRGIEKIYGVKMVKKWAIPEQEVRVSLDMEKLSQKRISMNQVMAAIETSNYNIPGGNIDIGSKRFNIRTSGSYESLEEVRNTIVFSYGEKVVFLRDIAEIRFENEDNLYLARANGKRAVFITVNQKEGTNIFAVMDGIQEQIKVFREKMPPSISLFTVFDQSEWVATRLDRFFKNLFQGLILVGAVVLLAIGLRASMIVMLAVPISILISLGFVDLSGFGLQQMTIAGLVISLGLLVDNAIVVTENISRFVKMGLSNKTAAVQGTGQIGGAIISSTATTILAFLPIAMMGYTTGEYIRSMPVTVIYTLLASLLVALTLTPFLSSRFFTIEKIRKESVFKRFLNTIIEKPYRKILNFSLSFPWRILLLMSVVFLISLYLFQFVGVSFFPKAEKPHLIVNINTPQGSSLGRTDEAARYVEKILERKEELEKYASSIGRGNPQIHYNVESKELTSSHAQIFVELKENDLKKIQDLVADFRREFERYPGARIEVKDIEQGPPVEAPVAIKILGENMEELRDIARDVETIFLSTPGTVNVNNPQGSSKTDLHIQINRAKAGLLGISMAEIDRSIRASIAGMTVSKYRDSEGKEYDIVVRLPFETKPKSEDFSRIYVTSITGAHIPLSQISSVVFKSSPKQIDHYKFERTVTVTADVEAGYSVDKVTRAIIAELDMYPWPKGYEYYVSGQLESREESFGGMGKAVIIALISIFAVLVLQFKSFSQPLVVFTAIPLALIGSILALLITGNNFSFTAFVGLTSLIGIVVNNSIILVDYTNKLRAGGKELIAALKEAGETRFTPIVLTTATTIGGLLPLTLRGGTMWGPMGWTIIGGLLVSTFLTLIIVPVLYSLFTRRGARF